MSSILNIALPEDASFSWTIRFETNQTFDKLHEYLQSILAYDSSELASFYIVDEQWEKLQEITLMDMHQDENTPAFLMTDMTISDYFNEEQPKLLYTFDFLNDRSFQLEWLQQDAGDAPDIIAKEGKAPRQINDNLSDLLDL